MSIELLSPAGNLHKLKLALHYGADAVYGGVSHFSLRNRSSKEFSYESFFEGVEYVKSLGKKIYVTINSFPFNSQIELYKTHIKKISQMQPDAFIVSTPGVIELCKDIAPEVPLHLSTQANVLNYMDAKAFYKMGVSRIIAAREISLNDLKEIKQAIPELELEAFVHGSMCFAYSGRCLISSLQTGRVANRGSCANDCRFEYEIYTKEKESGTLLRLKESSEGTYIFNAKDLNLSAYIEDIIKSKVIDSLKIEGRTKSPYYTALTAKVYKEAIIDAKNSEFDATKYEKELDKLTNRGYSDGYLFSRPYSKHIDQNLETPEIKPSIQVCGEVGEDEKSFMCKHTIVPNEELEILSPLCSKIECAKNELGEVFFKQDRYYLKLYKITNLDKKELDSVHSGYEIPIKLPQKLPCFSFLRKEVS
ncbi:MAG: U32 family peptidase [Campylobacterales bacterium]